MNWALPAAVYAIINLLVMALGVVALRGKLTRTTAEEATELAEVRGEKIAELRAEVAELRAEIVELREHMAAAAKLAEARQVAAEALIAQLQANEKDAGQRNLELQRKLDRAEAGRKPRKGNGNATG